MLSIWIFSLSIAFAQTPAQPAVATADPAIALADAIRKGLAFSPEIQKADSEKRAADDGYKIAQSKLFPTVNFKASGGTQKRSSAFSRTGIPGSVNETYDARIEAEQVLFQGGVVVAGLSAAKLERDVKVQRVFATKQEYTYKIIDSYLTAAEAQVLLEISKENRQVLKAYADITARYAAIGRSKNIDRLQAEASYNLSEAQVLQSESELERNRQDLLRLLGSPEATQPLDTQIPAQSVETGGLDQLYKKALENNPEIKALQLEVESLKYANRVKMSTHRPKLTLNGTYGYGSPDRVDWIEKNSELYSLTLNLTVPLFSGFSSFAESDSYTQILIQKEKDLQIKQIEIQKSLAKALATVKREFSRLKLTQASAASSKRAMDAGIRDYRNGLLSSTDVLNIQRTRFEADRQYTTAQFSYNRQVLSLRRDLGIDLEKAYVTR